MSVHAQMLAMKCGPPHTHTARLSMSHLWARPAAHCSSTVGTLLVSQSRAHSVSLSVMHAACLSECPDHTQRHVLPLPAQWLLLDSNVGMTCAGLCVRCEFNAVCAKCTAGRCPLPIAPPVHTSNVLRTLCTTRWTAPPAVTPLLSRHPPPSPPAPALPSHQAASPLTPTRTRLAGDAPEACCPHLPCSRSFHQRCLAEWLGALESTSRVLTTLFGKCPYCEEPISARSTV